VEAQACAIPVLGAAMGGIPESFADGVSGLLLPAGHSDAWRDAILRLASDRGLCRQLAAKGPAQVEGFAADAIAREFLAALGR